MKKKKYIYNYITMEPEPEPEINYDINYVPDEMPELTKEQEDYFGIFAINNTTQILKYL